MGQSGREMVLLCCRCCAGLTDSMDVKQYIKKKRSRDQELTTSWGTICTLTPMMTSDYLPRQKKNRRFLSIDI